MTRLKTILLAAALAAPAGLAAGSASAQVAVADLNQAVGNTRAMNTARQQIQTTYKTQIDQANARSTALEAELRPLVTAFNTARAAPNANQASLQTQATAIQTKQQSAQTELNRILLPAQRAGAYAEEQVTARLSDAVTAAMRARNVTVLLRPEATFVALPAADITAAITSELDKTVTTASITPPANWQPGQRQAGTPAATPAPAANNQRPQPQGR